MGSIEGNDYRIDWEELLDFYNQVFNTKYKSIKGMLKGGYGRFKSLKEFSIKLDISSETLRLKLKKLNIKLNPRGQKKRRIK